MRKRDEHKNMSERFDNMLANTHHNHLSVLDTVDHTIRINASPDFYDLRDRFFRTFNVNASGNNPQERDE